MSDSELTAPNGYRVSLRISMSIPRKPKSKKRRIRKKWRKRIMRSVQFESHLISNVPPDNDSGLQWCSEALTDAEQMSEANAVSVFRGGRCISAINSC